MKPFLSALVLACIGLNGASAQSPYPSKSVTIVVPYAAGGLSDSLARALGQRLSTTLKQQVIIDNKAGGNTVIGASAVAKAPADGYTLLLTAEATLAMNPHLYAKLPYHPEGSFAPVAALVSLPQAMAVSGSSAIKTLPELIASAKANPGKTSYATLGTGSTAHLNMELFRQSTGISLVSVPYKGASPALTDLMGGHVDAMVVATGLAARMSMPARSGSWPSPGPGARRWCPRCRPSPSSGCRASRRHPGSRCWPWPARRPKPSNRSMPR
jgi:tripartite-type tricarboxylate transporter receptor subunit TctC